MAGPNSGAGSDRRSGAASASISGRVPLGPAPVALIDSHGRDTSEQIGKRSAFLLRPPDQPVPQVILNVDR